MLIYLDSSAIVKLVRPEPETQALLDCLRAGSDPVTSVLAAVEVPRAIGRTSSAPSVLQRCDLVLERIALIELDQPIRDRAAELKPSELRSLDAIHIATVLDLGSSVGSMVTYDGRQGSAARAAGIEVLSPS